MLGGVFEVLAEPNRRLILDLLRQRERAVGELVERLGISQPAVSKHLRVLRGAGLVEVRADAQRRVYRLRPDPLREIDAWLAPYRAAWPDRLDALEHHLDEMPADGIDERSQRSEYGDRGRAEAPRGRRADDRDGGDDGPR